MLKSYSCVSVQSVNSLESGSQYSGLYYMHCCMCFSKIYPKFSPRDLTLSTDHELFKYNRPAKVFDTFSSDCSSMHFPYIRLVIPEVSGLQYQEFQS